MRRLGYLIVMELAERLRTNRVRASAAAGETKEEPKAAGEDTASSETVGAREVVTAQARR